MAHRVTFIMIGRLDDLSRFSYFVFVVGDVTNAMIHNLQNRMSDANLSSTCITQASTCFFEGVK